MDTPTAEAEKAPEMVLLRNKDNSKTENFEAGHADRILKYPNSRWEKVSEEVSGDGSGTQLPPADDSEKTAEATGTKRKSTAA